MFTETTLFSIVLIITGSRDSLDQIVQRRETSGTVVRIIIAVSLINYTWQSLIIDVIIIIEARREDRALDRIQYIAHDTKSTVKQLFKLNDRIYEEVRTAGTDLFIRDPRDTVEHKISRFTDLMSVEPESITTSFN